MLITSLTLKNFRNYENETFAFGEGINVIVGPNAQGKTNCAEAIFLSCTGYSPRATRDAQLIRYGEERADITCACNTLYGEVKVEVGINRSDKKSVKINGVKILRIGELFGNVNSVFFNPGELKLVQESPEDRRRFMNISLSQMNKNYFYALTRYNKVLEQRNKLLKGDAAVKETLPIWDEQLVKNGAKIIKARNDFLKVLSPLAEEAHAKLTGENEKLKISAENPYFGDEEEIAYAFSSDLISSRDKDMRLGFTNVGPHRDDIDILLGGRDVKTYGSQGQQRTVALSIKLAETEIFKNRFGEYPILILDDVLSELDKKRQKKLLALLDGIQTIITATSFERSLLSGKPFSKISVKMGKIKT